MWREHLDYLRCPLSGEPLAVAVSETGDDGHILAGELTSSRGRYPIEGGVPRFMLERSATEHETVEAFGQQWQQAGAYSWTYGQDRDYFDQYFHPLEPEELSGKNVLDAGCGNGRLVEYGARFQPALLVGLDYSVAVDIAFERNRSAPNVLIVQGSILEPPLAQGVFDIVYSLGVIHHLAAPARGVSKLGELLAPGGKMHLWTYSFEGNEAYLAIARPLRRFVRHLPSSMLRPLSFVLAVLGWPYVWLCGLVQKRSPGSTALPMGAYLGFLSGLGFRVFALVIHDQLTPEIAHYPTRHELMSWCDDDALDVFHVDMRTGNSWRAGIRKHENHAR